MVTTDEMRTATIHLPSGEIAEIEIQSRSLDLPNELREEHVSERYLPSRGALAPEPGESLLDHARK